MSITGFNRRRRENAEPQETTEREVLEHGGQTEQRDEERPQAEKEQEVTEQKPEEVPEEVAEQHPEEVDLGEDEDEPLIVRYEDLPIRELRHQLDVLGIPYKKKATKPVLIELLRGD